MRYGMVLLAGLVLAGGCATMATSLRVESRPEGLAVDLQGFRFLLRDVYELSVDARNVGDGRLYRLNDHEILILTSREIRLDGRFLDLAAGEMHEILPAHRSPAVAPPTPVR
ncbi:MAG: hypothetical protein JXQ29_11735 [Planctomycetes bacterium]|nr:hypothetical protein [Planctomycetota bacterium]